MASDDQQLRNAQQEIVRTFNNLRLEQRQIVSKISELEVEFTEHKLVLETLEGVEPERKCYRMVGGILVERNVKEVLPAIKSNKEQLTNLIQLLKGQLEAKGKEIMEFREKHNIQFKGLSGLEKPGKEDPKSAGQQGVLVESKT